METKLYAAATAGSCWFHCWNSYFWDGISHRHHCMRPCDFSKLSDCMRNPGAIITKSVFINLNMTYICNQPNHYNTKETVSTTWQSLIMKR